MASNEKSRKGDSDSVTRDEPGHPKNVGKSAGRRGENVVKREGKEPGRYDHKEKDGRVVGKSTPRDVSGIKHSPPKT